MIDIVLESIWSPIIFIIVTLLVTLVAYILYKMGNSAYTKTKYKGQPFISGNRSPSDVREIHVGSDNVFWGFTEAFKKYFEPLIKGHTGIINDYMYWVVITIAVVLVYIYLGV